MTDRGAEHALAVRHRSETLEAMNIGSHSGDRDAGSGDELTRCLIEEAREKSRQASTAMGVDERVLATGVTLIGIAASVAVAQGKSFLLMVVPVALASLFSFIAYRYAEVFALSGYQAVLEEAVEARVGAPVISWESRVAETRHRATPTRIFLGVVALAYLGSAVDAIAEALATRSAQHWGHGNSTLLIVLTLLSIVSGTAWSVAGFWSALAERRRVESLCRDQLLPSWLP
jgi:hypothetical protein